MKSCRKDSGGEDVPGEAAETEAADPLAAVRARFLEQGADPTVAKKALEDATSLSRGPWLSFLDFSCQDWQSEHP